MTGKTLRVTDVRSGAEIGTMTLDEDGEWQFTGEADQLVASRLERGWSNDRIWRSYDGWSNGYIKVASA
ncbi:VCBS repeat-containing protein [Sinosporangium album]|uniref:VCBS repeat-containing protein n=1 Tax=Sinosporangium album TaxID=504805 RepID=A0A1G8EC54_9ACTN|nr:VCBS domain-containing protein [Sinosporangium album]SDH67437.1 VCBS repeat-containing protein [Sinosporangium album]